MMEMETGLPVVLAKTHTPLNRIPGTEEDTLFENYNKLLNDDQLQKSITWFDNKYHDGFIMSKLAEDRAEPESNSKQTIIEYYKSKIDLKDRTISSLRKENDRLKYDLNEVWNSVSLRIGRIITGPARKIRDMLFRR